MIYLIFKKKFYYFKNLEFFYTISTSYYWFYLNLFIFNITLILIFFNINIIIQIFIKFDKNIKILQKYYKKLYSYNQIIIK